MSSLLSSPQRIEECFLCVIRTILDRQFVLDSSKSFHFLSRFRSGLSFWAELRKMYELKPARFVFFGQALFDCGPSWLKCLGARGLWRVARTIVGRKRILAFGKAACLRTPGEVWRAPPTPLSNGDRSVFIGTAEIVKVSAVENRLKETRQPEIKGKTANKVRRSV